jgi:SAM-dependent methyltransferase
MNRPAVMCKVCGQAARYLCETLNEHSRTRMLHHHRCPGCGLVFVGDSLDDQELGEAYATLDQATYYQPIKAENERKMRSCIGDLDRLASRDARVLDLGTGDGQFLGMLLEAGFTRLAGHEIPGGDDLASLVARGCAIYRDFDYASVPSGSADVITLLDVAEHVQDPKRLFRACHRVLGDGGIVYFHTPVVTSLDRVMHLVQKLPVVDKVGRIWQRGRTSVFHLQNYSRLALETLLAGAGFGD